MYTINPLKQLRQGKITQPELTIQIMSKSVYNKSPRTFQFGRNIAKTSYSTQIIQGVDPRDLKDWLGQLTTATKEDKLKEIEALYKAKKIKNAELKQALEYVVERIDTELKTSQETIDKLRAQGDTQLASVLEQLNEAFQKADVNQLLAVSEGGVKRLKQDAAMICLRSAEKLELLLQYTKAEEKYKEAMDLQESAGMTEQLEYGICLNDLALLYGMQGKYAQAEILYKKALNMYKKVLDEKHPEYATSLNNLGLLYRSQRKYVQAEPLFKRALSIRKEVLGTRHPFYAATLNNLALVYSDQGKYAQAEPLYQEAIDLQKSAAMTEQLEYSVSLNNLAELYCKLRKYKQAEPLYREALKICEHVLVKDHPTTKTIRANMNRLLQLMPSIS